MVIDIIQKERLGMMMMGEVFERFISESPLTVMLRVLLEQSLPASSNSKFQTTDILS